jgi:hypothetical protein
VFGSDGEGDDWLRAAVELVTRLPQGVGDDVRIDRLRLLEDLKAAASAAQAQEAVALAASQQAKQRAVGIPGERAERGIASQLGLAMRTSPWHAQRFLGWSRVLTTELPNTFAALQTGRVSERRAMIVARETIWLAREDRLAVDEQIAPRLNELGDKKLEAAVKTIAYRLDPTGYVARSAAAANERTVSLRPAPDAMARLTAFVPLAQGVACYAALTRTADTTTASGDERGRGQIMADTLVERVTGQRSASEVPVEVHLVMTAGSLLAPDAQANAEPALLDGIHPLPAPEARALVLDAAPDTPVWLRRLYTAPDQRSLVAMESTRRTFTPAQRRFIRLRDGVCRTPWCEAPIRHVDHVVAHGAGGATQIDNGQGYCAACNHAKQAPGWTNTVVSRAGPHEVEIVTPTGHRYRSRAPDVPQVA